jgi:hypothetical protein
MLHNGKCWSVVWLSGYSSPWYPPPTIWQLPALRTSATDERGTNSTSTCSRGRCTFCLLTSETLAATMLSWKQIGRNFMVMTPKVGLPVIIDGRWISQKITIGLTGMILGTITVWRVNLCWLLADMDQVPRPLIIHIKHNAFTMKAKDHWIRSVLWQHVWLVIIANWNDIIFWFKSSNWCQTQHPQSNWVNKYLYLG